jgi:putative methyltransferase (TIGR04325 family)
MIPAKNSLKKIILFFRNFVKKFSSEIILELYHTLKYRTGFILSSGKKVGYENIDLYKNVVSKTLNYRDNRSHEGTVLNSNLSLLVGFFANLTRPIKVLDFGGGAGLAYYEINRIFPGLILEWSVVETELLVKLAKHTENEQLKFYNSIQEANLQNKYDLIFASSSIPYSLNPIETLSQLIDLSAKNIIITRNALTDKASEQKILQISDLKSNGPGLGGTELKNKFVAYPLVILRIRDFESIVQSKYEIIGTFSQGFIKYWTLYKNYKFESFEYILQRK